MHIYKARGSLKVTTGISIDASEFEMKWENLNKEITI